MYIPIHAEKPEKTLVNVTVNSVCPLCSKSASIRIVCIQPYVRMFFIPMLPVFRDRLVRGICSVCDESFSEKKFTEALDRHYKEVKKSPPLWMFTGAALLVTLIAGIVTLIIMMKNMEAKAVLKPQQGDVYNIKLDDRRFTIIKVNAVKNDSVYLIRSMFETNDNSGFVELYDKEYDTLVKVVPKTQIKEWYDSNFIIGVVPHD